ncbi:hypothetical protein TNCV_3251921 [Trichonephila clavipes]|nr:hypothetical protein TNCV_3251921 [Trichonephila clavipes]
MATPSLMILFQSPLPFLTFFQVMILILVIKEIYPFSPRSVEMRQSVVRRALLPCRCDVIFPSLSNESETEAKSTGRGVFHVPHRQRCCAALVD